MECQLNPKNIILWFVMSDSKPYEMFVAFRLLLKSFQAGVGGSIFQY